MKQRSVVIQRKLLAIACFALFLGLFLFSPAWAIESRGGEQVNIPRSEVVDTDLYVSGSVVTIDGTVRGDVIGVGRQITVNGLIEGDLIAAGQAIVINGTVEDDVRIAGQVLQVGSNAQIADDVVATGASFEGKAGSRIAGDLSFMGGQALLAGTVQQDVKGRMAALELRGTIDRNVDVTVGGDDRLPAINPPFTPQPQIAIPTVGTGLTVTNSARIGGKLNYRSSSQAKIDPAAQIRAGVNRVAIESARIRPALLIWGNVQRWMTLLLVGIFLLWLLPSGLQRMAMAIQAKPLPTLGWGIITMLILGALAIAIPIFTIVLTALLGSFLWNLAPLILGIGFLTTLIIVIGFLLFIGYIPPVVVSLLGGQWLLRSAKGNWTSKQIASLALGLLIFVLLTAIPVLDGLIYLIVVLLGLGALWIWRQKRPTTTSDRPLAMGSPLS